MGKEINVGTNTRSDLRLRVQTVFSQVLEGHKTFGDIAPRYGLEVPEFEDLLRHKVDPKDFDRLKEMSEKYEELRHRKRKRKQVILQPISSNVVEAERDETPKEPLDIRNEILEKIEKELKQIFSLCNEIIPVSEAELEKAENEVEDAREKLKEAEKFFKTVQLKQEKAKNKLDKQNAELLACRERQNQLEEKLAEIDSKIIYLIAPNYKGDMPEYGTFISVIPKEGMTVEDVSKVTLMHEPTMVDLMEYADMEKAKEGYQYLQLVTKYFVESAEYNLLVDDPATLNLLRKQELIQE